MKTPRLIHALVLLLPCLATRLPAEEVTLRQAAVLKARDSMVSLKAGTVVELLARDGETLTVKYREITGKIPASKLREPKVTAAQPKDDPAPANPPQTHYGKAVQKAKDNAKAHDKNVVKPTEEIMP